MARKACCSAELAVARQAFDRHDRAVLRLADRDQAGADLRAVQQHRAGAAIAGIAADLGAGETEIVAQHVGQPRDRRDVAAPRPPVDREATVPGASAGAKPRARGDEFERQRAAIVRSAAHVVIGDSGARCSGATSSARRLERRAHQGSFEARQALRHRRARSRPRRARVATLPSRSRRSPRHDDRDDQIFARAQLEEGGLRASRLGRGIDRCRDDLIAGASAVGAIAGDELRDRQCGPTPARPASRPRVERQEVGRAVGGRRGVAEIAGERAGILDLAAADFAGSLLAAVEERRQRRLRSDRSRCERAQSASDRARRRYPEARRCR